MELKKFTALDEWQVSVVDVYDEDGVERFAVLSIVISGTEQVNDYLIPLLDAGEIGSQLMELSQE